MPLHERDTVREQIEDCVFAGRDLTRPVAKYKFPQDETQAREAYQVVADELILDGNARQNLATFCQTWEEPEALALMALSINKNMIDRDEYPQAAEIERRCVHMMADLWNAPEAANTVGTSAIGSSEACMLAGMAAKWRWRAKRRAEGKSTDNPNMVCGPVQVVWHKFARYWDIEMREVPMAHGSYMMDAASMLERVDENTIMVVPTLGVTYTGAYEPVEEMSKALDKLQADTGLDIDIHVDGASGGFLAPFCAPEVVFDFRLPRVKSISASGHKFGLAPLGVGWVIFRDSAELPDDLIFHVNYLGGDMPVFQINFSRRPARSSPAITTSSGSATRASAESTRRPTTSASTSPRRSSNWARSSCCATATRPPASLPSPGGSAKARTRATRCSTWPTGCACADGRCLPTPSPDQRLTSPCSASWSASA